MVACSLGIGSNQIREIFLPLVVGRFSVGDVTFYPQPIVENRQHPVVGQSDSDLRNGTRIDAERLRTATQRVVFQLHRIFLRTHRQHTVQPAHFAVSLLNDHLARVVVGQGDVESIADAPASQRIGFEWSLDGSAQVSVRAFQRTQSEFVRVEPQRCLSVGSRNLCLDLVFQSVEQVVCFVALLLCPQRKRRQNHEAKR